MSPNSPQPDPEYHAPARPEIESVDDMYDLAEVAFEGGTLDGADPRADNVRRAAFAAQAVIAYSDATGNRDLDTVISDLLGDMQHLLDVLRDSVEGEEDAMDIDTLLAAGSVHYQAEIRGEF